MILRGSFCFHLLIWLWSRVDWGGDLYLNNETELYDWPNQLETLEIELEEEVDTDEKGPYILQSEVEKAIKEMRNKKATGDDDVPGDVLKLLGEDGLKIMTRLITTMYETGEWPKDFTEKLQWFPQRRSHKLQNAVTIAQSALLHIR